MPNRDRKGPEGKGPLTGRGEGDCTSDEELDKTFAKIRRGRGRKSNVNGRGRGPKDGTGTGIGPKDGTGPRGRNIKK